MPWCTYFGLIQALAADFENSQLAAFAVLVWNEIV